MDHSYPSSRVDQFLEEKIKSRTNSLFKSRNDAAQLVVYLFSSSKDSCGRRTLQTKQPIPINHISELKRLHQEETIACAQVYTVAQLRSWTTLNISSELFHRLLEEQSVFPYFWKSVLTFGIRVVENEYAFPSFRAKSSQRGDGKVDEIAYVIRRVERNQRPTSKGECPWSIRQTGVYHKLTYPHDGSASSSVFILIAPSRTTENEVSQCFPGSPFEGEVMKPHFSIHERLIADGLSCWMDYMAWLESECKQKADRLIVWDVEDGDKHMTYFKVDDRQRLKQLGDYITDLIVVLQTAVNTIGRIGKSCQRHCQMSCGARNDCSCSSMIEEFSEYEAESRIYLERAKVLQERVQSTEQLLTDLLSFEETRALKQLARASHVETKALKELAQTSQEESHHLAELAKRSAEDAAAVKMLSLVGLVYLPTTIVANFFSTEFVKVNEQGDIYISPWVWILAVISVPLTVATIFLWILSVRYSDSSWFLKVTRVRHKPVSPRDGEDADMERGRLRGRAETQGTMPLFSLMRPSTYATTTTKTD
ncbi:hypothetical protein ABOM_007453 [Aspergillus bombycis]|uniref:CorA-like transporter domain-containing protein n=1 Tax=Aspergillus bombycis TaxID=109264 RepID=A0A1F8A022_9EURO|nr:hypothetical protein ABOM_007453 [Aspergillus bombycis]OGM44678.1 hypothetical protein ABOM_007453 [Aspergillus bombycis]